jgi:hypothetical protein
VAFATPAGAQTEGVKERAPMYTYEASWVYPRAMWPEVEKGSEAGRKIVEKAMASGGLVGSGSDARVIHTIEGDTQDTWFSGTSQAAVLNVLDEVAKANSGPSMLTSATKHWDGLYVSRYYNWKSGTWKGAYTRGSTYTLKPDAPNDAIDVLAKSFISPLMEKLLAEGTIIEYEIDTEAVHTADPAEFYLMVITPTAEGLDKLTAALSEAMRKSPTAGPALGAFVEMSKHRDSLLRSTVTYK